MRGSVWSCLGSLEPTHWDTDLTGAKAGLLLIALFPPSGQCASQVPALSQAGKSGDQAVATVLRMVRPQVSWTLSSLSSQVCGLGVASAHLQGSGQF